MLAEKCRGLMCCRLREELPRLEELSPASQHARWERGLGVDLPSFTTNTALLLISIILHLLHWNFSIGEYSHSVPCVARVRARWNGQPHCLHRKGSLAVLGELPCAASIVPLRKTLGHMDTRSLVPPCLGMVLSQERCWERGRVKSPFEVRLFSYLPHYDET